MTEIHSERDAFEMFVAEHGEASSLLIDTYDTVYGAQIATEVADEMEVDIRGVRLDSGDLPSLSKEVNKAAPGLDQYISSGIDKYTIKDFFERDGIGSGFSLGTALVTSTDTPKVEGVYKLFGVERDGRMHPTTKLSKGKVTYPDAKSVLRIEEEERYTEDIIGLRDEEFSGKDLLRPVIEDGVRIVDLLRLDTIRTTTREQRRKLPKQYRPIEDPEAYNITINDKSQTETDGLRASLEQRVNK